MSTNIAMVKNVFKRTIYVSEHNCEPQFIRKNL